MTDSVMTQSPVASGSQEFSWSWFLWSAKGRITRSDYWLRFVLPYTIGLIVVVVLDVMLGLGTSSGYGIITIIYSLIFIYPSFVIMIKRWHDRDKSGWWTLIIFVPIIGSIWLFVECGCMEGTRGPNRFGPSRFASEQNLGEVFE